MQCNSIECVNGNRVGNTCDCYTGEYTGDHCETPQCPNAPVDAFDIGGNAPRAVILAVDTTSSMATAINALAGAVQQWIGAVDAQRWINQYILVTFDGTGAVCSVHIRNRMHWTGAQAVISTDDGALTFARAVQRLRAATPAPTTARPTVAAFDAIRIGLRIADTREPLVLVFTDSDIAAVGADAYNAAIGESNPQVIIHTFHTTRTCNY